MRRNLAWLRPYVFGTVLAGILTFDLSNQWEVPVSQLPGEFFERHVDGFDPHADPAALLALAEKATSRRNMSTRSDTPPTRRSNCRSEKTGSSPSTGP